jgi:hypothetical protein
MILSAWFNRFIPKATADDLKRRSELTGIAKRTRSYWFGDIEISCEKIDPASVAYTSPNVFDGTRELSPEYAERLRKDYQRTHGGEK